MSTLSRVAGHSGCKVELLYENQMYLVRKSTSTSAYAERLRKQAIKQQKFRNTNRLNFITTPSVIKQFKDEATYFFDMEYSTFADYVHYLSTANIQDLEFVVEAIISLIHQNIEHSRFEKIAGSVIFEKYNDVKRNILNNPILGESEKICHIFNQSDSIFTDIDTITIPVGQCHGDLTLSNILFSKFENRIILIDFLDSFIETPLMDMVKIRQDTKYRWSYNMLKFNFDKIRMDLILKSIDDKLSGYFCQHSFFLRYYQIFQILNFLRILQYAKNKEITEYLLKTIVSLLEEDQQNELNYTCSR